MKVLHIVSWFPHDGQPLEGRFIADRIRGLSSWCDNEVAHIQLKRVPAWVKLKYRRTPGLHQIVLESRWLRWAWLERLAVPLVFRAWKRAHPRPDIIVVHVAYPLLVHFHRIRAQIPVPVVVSEHWSAYHHAFHLPEDHPALHRMRHMLDQVDGVIAVSPALMNDIERFTGGGEWRRAIIPNPVDEGLFHSLPGAVRKGFFALNRWSSIKRPFLLLEAWSLFVSRYPGEELVIAGEGPLYPEMKMRVQLHQIPGVRFPGVLSGPEVARQMQRSSGLVVSSAYETFCLSAAEALMCGTPVASSPLEALEGLAEEGDVTLATADDAAGLAEAIECVHQARASRDHAAMARRARSRFDASASNETFYRFLESFLVRTG